MSIINYNLKHVVTSENERFMALLSKKEAINHHMTIVTQDRVDPNHSLSMSTALVEVVQGSAPVPCKVYIGDREEFKVMIKIIDADS